MMGATIGGDIAAVAAAYILAFSLRFAGWFMVRVPPRAGVPEVFPYYIYGLLAVCFIHFVVFTYLGFYRAHRVVSPLDEFYSAIIGCSLGTFIVMAAIFMLRGFEFSRPVVLIAWVFSIVAVGVVRVSEAAAQAAARARGVGVVRTVVVGAGRTGQMVVERIESHPALGYRTVGFLDDDTDLDGKSVEGFPVLGTTGELVRVIRSERIGVVIVALSSPPRDKIMQLITRCQEEEVEFKVVSDIFEIIAGPVAIDAIDGLPMFGLKDEPLSHLSNRVLKRAVDIIGAVLGIVVFTPLGAVIAAAVKASSPGRVFFRQDRVGHDGRVFRILKFRSMRADAEKGGRWTTHGDARRTRIGRHLRRLSLDEIPQLWCVLKGDMSLSGPRPEQPLFVEEFKQRVPRYLERHKVKSGITGWAQVNGLRGDTDIEQRTKYDLYYVENWSLMFDFKILLKTCFEFVFHRSAY